MTNRFLVGAITAVVMVVGSAAQAQQNVCQANIAQVLSEYGVKFSDVVNRPGKRCAGRIPATPTVR